VACVRGPNFGGPGSGPRVEGRGRHGQTDIQPRKWNYTDGGRCECMHRREHRSDRGRRRRLRRAARRLAPDRQAAQPPEVRADPGRPARLPPGDHRAATGGRRHPRRRRGAHPAAGHAGRAGPLRPDRDQRFRPARPAAAHRGRADRLGAAGAGARQPAQRLRHPRPGPAHAVAVFGQRRRAGVGGGQQSARRGRGRHRPGAAAPPGGRGGRRRRRHRSRTGRRTGRDPAPGGQRPRPGARPARRAACRGGPHHLGRLLTAADRQGHQNPF
jgi:translation initiation factor IF-2